MLAQNNRMNSKEEYFEYFHNHKSIKKIIKTTESRQQLIRPKTSQYELAQLQKLLPHITEEYQYRITNQLLQYKINHPRRDKLIVEAVQSATLSRDTASRKNRRPRTKQTSKLNHSQSCQPTQTENWLSTPKDPKQPKLSILGKKSQIQRLYKTFGDLNSACNNYKNDYLISLQNTRMGKRLINARSMVSDILTKTYYTYQMYNGKLANKDKFMNVDRNSAKFRKDNRNFGKINNGIKSFFHNNLAYSQHHQPSETNNTTNDEDTDNHLNKTITLQDKSLNKLYRDEGQSCSLNSHAYQTRNPLILETYGSGQYSFVINKLIIKSNPPLKPESLLVLQLIERRDKLSNISNRYYAEKNNYCKQYCPTETKDADKDCFTSSSFTYDYISSDKGYGIKFRMHRLRQFYIRILRNEGIQQRQVGIFKINLVSYFNRQKGEFPFTFYLEEKEIQGVVKHREIFQSKFEGNLIKYKKGETNTEVKMEYLFYNRHFKSLSESQEPVGSTLHSTAYQL